MPHIKSVNIPKPCHESWLSMNPVAGGRHCQSCCKTVTDFTTMSNDEIIAHLSVNQNVCGRFSARQLINIDDYQINNMPFMPKLKGWALLLAMLGPVTIYKATAQNKPTTVQTNCCSVPESETPVIIGEVVLQNKTITGIVTDEQNLPIAGAVINIPGTKLAAITNSSGKFSLQIPEQTTEFDAHAIGFMTQNVTLNADVLQQNYNIRLKEASTILGEVVVTIKRPPFFKRIYIRYVRRPYRTLKKKLTSL